MPQAKLLMANPYRSPDVFRPSKELSGGASQLQAYCTSWETEGARLPQNARRIDADTFSPKGLLIVGHTFEFDKDDDANKSHYMKRSFELFRRNLANPEIVTYDELYERAKFIVDSEGPRSEGNGPTDLDELPF